MNEKLKNSVKHDRRDFLKSTGAVLVGGAVFPFGLSAQPNFLKNNTLKVGLIGCGGRGTGAAVQALKADPHAVLTCMADIFPDYLEESYTSLVKANPAQVKVDKEHQFIGFDAYQKVLESDVDVVL